LQVEKDALLPADAIPTPGIMRRQQRRSCIPATAAPQLGIFVQGTTFEIVMGGSVPREDPGLYWPPRVVILIPHLSLGLAHHGRRGNFSLRKEEMERKSNIQYPRVKFCEGTKQANPKQPIARSGGGK
jgi:hypothetical protein